MAELVIGDDMHLRHNTWPTTGLALFDDSYVALEELRDEAYTRDAGLVFPGDIFDHGISADSPKNLDELIRITRGVGQVIYTVGNHDRTGGSSGGANPEWVEVVNRKYPHSDETGSYEIGDDWMYEENYIHEMRGVLFACIHHVGGEEDFEAKVRQLLDLKKEFDVLVIHQAMKELLGVYGAYEVDLDRIGDDLHSAGCRLIIAGHVHASQDWVWQDKITVVSPGESYPKTLDDQMQKRFPIVTVDPGRVKVEWKNYERGRIIRHMVATADEEYEMALAEANTLRQIAESSRADIRVRKPVLSLSYVPIPGFKARIVEILGGQVALFEHQLREAKMARATMKSLAAESVSPEATMKEIARITELHTQEGAIREDLMRIQNGESPEAVIEERIRKETA